MKCAEKVFDFSVEVITTNFVHILKNQTVANRLLSTYQGRQHDFQSGGPKHNLFLDLIIFLLKRYDTWKSSF